MRSPTPQRKGLALAIACLLAIGVFAFLQSSTRHLAYRVQTSGVPRLTTVSAVSLARNGIVLSRPPSGIRPDVSSRQAARTVTRTFGDAIVEEVVLADVSSIHHKGRTSSGSRLMWVVSTLPACPGGISCAGVSPAHPILLAVKSRQYVVALVNASNGSLVRMFLSCQQSRCIPPAGPAVGPRV
jgi:hypothetical protein